MIGADPSAFGHALHHELVFFLQLLFELFIELQFIFVFLVVQLFRACRRNPYCESNLGLVFVLQSLIHRIGHPGYHQLHARHHGPCLQFALNQQQQPIWQRHRRS